MAEALNLALAPAKGRKGASNGSAWGLTAAAFEAPPPVDAPLAEIVASAYRTILGREPDTGGLTHYCAKLAGGVLTLGQFRGHLLLSSEFLNRYREIRDSAKPPSADRSEAATADTIASAYLWLLGRDPDKRGFDNYLARVKDPSAAEVRLSFLRSAEFTRQVQVIEARSARSEGRLDEAERLIRVALPGGCYPDPAARAESIAIRSARTVEARAAVAQRHALRAEDLPTIVKFMSIGTTGQCNASCIHCPTGKASTAHVPRHPMPMPLFEKIVRGLAEAGLSVKGHFNLGLFGDGLLDPFVVERVELVREILPEVYVCVNTNAAAYNPARHRALVGKAGVLMVHIESLIPEVYDRVMAPLRAERVFEKVDMILEDFRGVVEISIPTHRENLGELRKMREYFVGKGARGVHFAPLISRSAEQRDVFNRLAISPHRHRCDRTVLDDLIIDCDGLVLMCCNDFSRIEPLGDLNRESVIEILLNGRRKAMEGKLMRNEHDHISICANCYADVRTDVD